MRGSEDKARQYALKLLSYRGRSLRELGERLRRKGFPENVVSSTLKYLKQTGIIDDRALAEALKREAMTTKLLSQYGTRRFMIMRGIPREIVDSIMISDEKEDMENAQKLVDKRLRVMKNFPAETKKRRLHSLLLRKGYSFETIEAVLKKKNFKED